MIISFICLNPSFETLTDCSCLTDIAIADKTLAAAQTKPSNTANAAAPAANNAA